MMLSASKKKLLDQEKIIFDALGVRRAEIKQKLEEANQVNIQLEAAVQETKQLSVSLVGKLRKELKVAKKSLSSICKKLRDGVFLVDFEGKVVQLNHAGENLLGISERDVLGKDIGDVITEIDPMAEEQAPIFLTDGFFLALSHAIIKQTTGFTNGQKYAEATKVFKELMPGMLEPEVELNLSAKVNRHKIKLTFVFSILDNDPEEINDLAYVFVFSKAQ